MFFSEFLHFPCIIPEQAAFHLSPNETDGRSKPIPRQRHGPINFSRDSSLCIDYSYSSCPLKQVPELPINDLNTTGPRISLMPINNREEHKTEEFLGHKINVTKQGIIVFYWAPTGCDQLMLNRSRVSDNNKNRQWTGMASQQAVKLMSPTALSSINNGPSIVCVLLSFLHSQHRGSRRTPSDRQLILKMKKQQQRQ